MINRQRLATIACDGLGLAGIGLVVAGIDIMSRPAAMIIAGLFAVAAAWRWARIA